MCRASRLSPGASAPPLRPTRTSLVEGRCSGQDITLESGFGFCSPPSPGAARSEWRASRLPAKVAALRMLVPGADEGLPCGGPGSLTPLAGAMSSKVLVSERCGEKDTPLSALSTFFTSALSTFFTSRTTLAIFGKSGL